MSRVKGTNNHTSVSILRINSHEVEKCGLGSQNVYIVYRDGAQGATFNWLEGSVGGGS